MEKGKPPLEASVFVEWFYDRIPEGKKKEYLARKKKMMSPSGNLVKVQCYLSQELYIVLRALGAFNTSEAAFFAGLGMEFADKKITAVTKLEGPLKEA